MNTRLYNWRSRHSKKLIELQPLPFVWGQNDCLIIAGKLVEAMTGEDLYSMHIDKYDSLLSAQIYLQSLGFETIMQFLSSKLESCHISAAQYGDLCAVQEEYATGCGSILGERIVCPSPFSAGMGSLSRSRALDDIAYKVGW